MGKEKVCKCGQLKQGTWVWIYDYTHTNKQLQKHRHTKMTLDEYKLNTFTEKYIQKTVKCRN